MNRNFGKLNDRTLTYAPETLRIGDTYKMCPSAAQYAALGWLPVIDERPDAKDGVYFVPDGWEERDGAIRRVYREEQIVEPPEPATRYSKLKLIVAAKAAGKWEAFKAFIAQAGYEDEWAAAQFLSSDYAQFEQAQQAIIAAGVATAEEIAAILAASVDEEVGV